MGVWFSAKLPIRSRQGRSMRVDCHKKTPLYRFQSTSVTRCIKACSNHDSHDKFITQSMVPHRAWEPREVDLSGWALGSCEALRGVQYDLINQSINQCRIPMTSLSTQNHAEPGTSTSLSWILVPLINSIQNCSRNSKERSNRIPDESIFEKIADVSDSTRRQ